jgi:hypothetical protein
MQMNERRGDAATSRRAPDRVGRCWVPCLEKPALRKTTRTYASARDIVGADPSVLASKGDHAMAACGANHALVTPSSKVAREVSRGCRC